MGTVRDASVLDINVSFVGFRHICSPEMIYKPSEGHHFQLSSHTTSSESSRKTRNLPFMDNYIFFPDKSAQTCIQIFFLICSLNVFMINPYTCSRASAVF